MLAARCDYLVMTSATIFFGPQVTVMPAIKRNYCSNPELSRAPSHAAQIEAGFQKFSCAPLRAFS
jgi:hypothetical protein